MTVIFDLSEENCISNMTSCNLNIYIVKGTDSSHAAGLGASTFG